MRFLSVVIAFIVTVSGLLLADDATKSIKVFILSEQPNIPVGGFLTAGADLIGAGGTPALPSLDGRRPALGLPPFLLVHPSNQAAAQTHRPLLKARRSSGTFRIALTIGTRRNIDSWIH